HKLKMLKLIAAIVLLGVAQAFIFEEPEYTRRQIATVKELDGAKYTGRWYQVYGNKFGEVTYGKNPYCVMANYALINATTISVFNSGKTESVNGTWRQIEGSATQIDPMNEPGKFQLNLEFVPFPAAYWVMKLGPVKDGQYEYSLVTNDKGGALYVLVRDPVVFKQKYEKEALEFLEQKGFTEEFIKPVYTYHGADCPYVNKKQPNWLDNLWEIIGY
ncbi:unnamed protein product, partial [Owenia fusiformis]